MDEFVQNYFDSSKYLQKMEKSAEKALEKSKKDSQDLSESDYNLSLWYFFVRNVIPIAVFGIPIVIIVVVIVEAKKSKKNPNNENINENYNNNNNGNAE